MKRNSLAAVLALGAVGLCLTPAGATERQHGAHQHGLSQIDIAVDGHDVRIELRAPGADIVGFEHAARTAEQRAALTEARAALRDGARLFVFPEGAGCALEEASVRSPLLSALGDDGHGHDEGDAHAHDEEHGHDHAEEHGHDEDHGHDHGHGHGHDHNHDHERGHEHGGETHAEFTARYHFHCAEGARPAHVDVGLFDAFPGAERARVRLITDGGQTAHDLAPGDARVTF